MYCICIVCTGAVAPLLISLTLILTLTLIRRRLRGGLWHPLMLLLALWSPQRCSVPSREWQDATCRTGHGAMGPWGHGTQRAGARHCCCAAFSMHEGYVTAVQRNNTHTYSMPVGTSYSPRHVSRVHSRLLHASPAWAQVLQSLLSRSCPSGR